MLKASKRFLAIGFIALVLAPGGLMAQDALEKWGTFDFQATAIKPDQLKDLTLEDLKLLRGLIFGKHGRVFKDPAIRQYLAARDWYKPNPDFKNSMLTAVERQSLDLIRDAEAAQHDQVQPGDLRHYRTKLLTRKKLGTHSNAEWIVLRAELEAIHGKRFENDPWLQQYFDERYWYQPSEKYDPKLLSELERKNLQTIAAAQKLQRRLRLSPGDRELFENRRISELMFKEPWLQKYFSSFDWYKPDPEFTENSLNAIEKRNIATIAAYEKKAVSEMDVIEG